MYIAFGVETRSPETHTPAMIPGGRNRKGIGVASVHAAKANFQTSTVRASLDSRSLCVYIVRTYLYSDCA
jgi:hypothetical protein